MEPCLEREGGGAHQRVRRPRVEPICGEGKDGILVLGLGHEGSRGGMKVHQATTTAAVTTTTTSATTAAAAIAMDRGENEGEGGN